MITLIGWTVFAALVLLHLPLTQGSGTRGGTVTLPGAIAALGAVAGADGLIGALVYFAFGRRQRRQGQGALLYAKVHAVIATATYLRAGRGTRTWSFGDWDVTLPYSLMLPTEAPIELQLAIGDPPSAKYGGGWLVAIDSKPVSPPMRLTWGPRWTPLIRTR